MDIKFITETGAVLDISSQKISVQENNSKVSNQTFSKIMFPFETLVDENFIQEFGDFASYETRDLETVIPGHLDFEDKLSPAKLNIIDMEGFDLTGQTDYGLDEVPNFEKKLSELPLENFKVFDIHTYAKSVCEKKYPQTNFNFPRIYTDKYSPDDELWDAFNGYYNDLNPEGTEMLRNYINEEGNIFNQNIIHPCPHILYLLKTGFEDAGYQLAGDILNDEDLAQRWVFSGTEYFSKLTQLRTDLSITAMDYDTRFTVTAYYNKPLTVPKAGKYRLKGFFNSKGTKGTVATIKLDGVVIWSFVKSNYDDEIRYFNFEVAISMDNAVFSFYLIRPYSMQESSTEVIKAELINLEIQNPDDYEGEDNGVITNLNEIDLSRAVPEITFGELVNRVKNWFNYDMDVKDNIISMNKISSSVDSEGENFEFAEILRPKRLFLSGKSFLHKFSDLDNNVKLNSIFYDKNGSLLNGKEKTDTNIIEVNGYAMPVSKAKTVAPLTAKVMKEGTDSLALVWYDGLVDGQNNAKNPEGCNHPELFRKNWEAWFRQRIRGQEYQWTFRAPIVQMAKYTVKDYIFCYNNLHIIKSWTKDKVSDNTYEVQIITETVI